MEADAAADASAGAKVPPAAAPAATAEVPAAAAAPRAPKRPPRHYMLGRPQPSDGAQEDNGAAKKGPPPGLDDVVPVPSIGAIAGMPGIAPLLLPPCSWPLEALSPRTVAEVSHADRMRGLPVRIVEPGWHGKLAMMPEAEAASGAAFAAIRSIPPPWLPVHGRLASFRVGALRRLRLAGSWRDLNPVLEGLAALAQNDLPQPATVALLQLLVYFLETGADAVPCERFGTSRLCAFLGAGCEVIWSGKRLRVASGDVLLMGPLDTLEVPKREGLEGPLAVVCLFYSSTEQLATGHVSVQHGAPHQGPVTSLWWTPPSDGGQVGRGAVELSGLEEPLGGTTSLEAELRARWCGRTQLSREAKETVQRALRDAEERTALRKEAETLSRDDLQRLLNARLRRGTGS